MSVPVDLQGKRNALLGQALAAHNKSIHTSNEQEAYGGEKKRKKRRGREELPVQTYEAGRDRFWFSGDYITGCPRSFPSELRSSPPCPLTHNSLYGYIFQSNKSLSYILHDDFQSGDVCFQWPAVLNIYCSGSRSPFMRWFFSLSIT